MRLFITSYHKSGTHQIVPMFTPNCPDVVDRSHVDWINVPKRYRLNTEVNHEGVIETCGNLRNFQYGASKAFGHLAHRPEYAKVFMETSTKVLFNVRDPRDIVVAEYRNAQRKFAIDSKDMPLWNYYDAEAEKFLYDHDDPIRELIILASARWPQWIGWLDYDFVLKVKYEDLRLDTVNEVDRIRTWLNEQECYSAEIMVKKAKPAKSNPTFRRGVPGEWTAVFTPENRALADELLGDILDRLGYER